jgi:adenine C2-methylase RlmN of 23S rRNA A2503 and tRNA A37
MAKLQFIKNYNENELSEICHNLGYPKFHGTQIFKWIFHKSCESITNMTNIPLSLKNELKHK